MAEGLCKPENLPNLLDYASKQPAILRSGEIILWQGEPLKKEAPFNPGRQAGNEAVYFITQRRMVRSQPENALEDEVQSAQLPADNYRLNFKLDGLADFCTGNVKFERIVDWAGAVGSVARIHRKIGSQLGRRTKMVNEQIVSPSTVSAGDSVAGDLPLLLEGERIIWSGRPRTRMLIDWAGFKKAIQAFFILMIPTAFLSADLWDKESILVRTIVACGSVAWIVFIGHAFIFRPFFDIGKRKRTRYVLTDLRALMIEQRGKGRRIDFAFLNSIQQVGSITEYSDGSGDVTIIKPVAFMRIGKPNEIHKLIFETARKINPKLEEMDDTNEDILS